MGGVFRIVLACFILVSSAAYAGDGPALPVTGQESRLNLDTYLFVYQDTSARLLSLQALLGLPDRFRRNTSPVPNFGMTAGRPTQPIWLRFQLRNPTDRPLRLVTEVGFWYFDEIRLYLIDRGRLVYQSPVLGWKTPVERRMVPNRNFIFPFRLPAHATQTAYVRVVKRRGAQVVPITVRTQAAY